MVNNEHLTEALRRLRKSSSDDNVDRSVQDECPVSDAQCAASLSRLVTNILLSFLTTHRADSKRFEMLTLLSTILSWNDTEREKAGLQRVGGVRNGAASSPIDKGKRKDRRGERSAEEEAAMNEVCVHTLTITHGFPTLPSKEAPSL